MLRDLEQIARVISLRLGQACPSPQACSSQTSDVRYVVPPMFAQYRSVPHGLDPREDASSWADVVTRRDPPRPPNADTRVGVSVREVGHLRADELAEK